MLVVRGYTHHDGSIGVVAQFEIGTDFTSRTQEFKSFADGVLMSLAFWIRDQAQTPSDPPVILNEMNAMTAPWVAEGDYDTVQASFDAASKQFREPIRLIAFRSLSA